MDNTILIAIISFCGTLLGTFGGIVSGLASTGLHQLFKKFIEKGE